MNQINNFRKFYSPATDEEKTLKTRKNLKTCSSFNKAYNKKELFSSVFMVFMVFLSSREA